MAGFLAYVAMAAILSAIVALRPINARRTSADNPPAALHEHGGMPNESAMPAPRQKGCGGRGIPTMYGDARLATGP